MKQNLLSFNSEHRLVTTYEFDRKFKIAWSKIEPKKIGNYKYPLFEKIMQGGHGLFSTINDYSIFARMLHTGKSMKGTKF